MSRSILAGIISGPQALLGLIFFRSFTTPSLVTVISGWIRLTIKTWNVYLIFSCVDLFILVVKYAGFIHCVCLHLAPVLEWCNPTIILLQGLYKGPETLLLSLSVINVRITRVYHFLNMLPVCLPLCSLDL